MEKESTVKPTPRLSAALRMILVTLAILSLIITCLSIPVSSVEGVWRSPSFIGCMCDAYSFWELEDGVITTYSDRHNSGYVVGSYTKQEDGRFKITIQPEGVPDYEMIVTPHSLHWKAPTDIFNGKPSPWLARVFYRPLLRGRSDQVIADTLAAGPEPFP